MNGFGKLIKSKTISFNETLIRNYSKIGLTETEAMIIMLLYINAEENDTILSSGMLQGKLTLSEKELSNHLLELVKRGYISLNIDNSGKESYSLDEVVEKLGATLEEKEHKDSRENLLSEIVAYIESSYGRLITPSDLIIVREWLKEGYDLQAIKEAVFESIKAKKSHVRYADAILINRHKMARPIVEPNKEIQAILQGAYVKKRTRNR